MEKVTYEIESAGSRVMEIELGKIETQIRLGSKNQCHLRLNVLIR